MNIFEKERQEEVFKDKNEEKFAKVILNQQSLITEFHNKDKASSKLNRQLLGNVLLEMIFYKFLLAFVQGCDSGSLL
jgi:hypothetical protein